MYRDDLILEKLIKRKTTGCFPYSIQGVFQGEIKNDFFDDCSLGESKAWLSHTDIDHFTEVLDYTITETQSHDLAISDSINATIYHGYSQLIFSPMKVIQPILVLVNLTPLQRNWFTLPEELVSGLVARGIEVTIGYSNHNFDYFVDDDLNVINLIDWNRKYPKANLLIFLDTQTNQEIQYFDSCGWKACTVFTVRDRLQWDYRESQLLVKGIYLFPAYVDYVLDALNHSKLFLSGYFSHYQSFELVRENESDQEYLERFLGEAFGLGVALSIYPRYWSLKVAEHFRLRCFRSIKRLHLQRLVRLCSSGMGDSFSFDKRWKNVFLANYVQLGKARQKLFQDIWLGLLDASEPKNIHSNCWAGWQLRRSLLLWNDEPDQQVKVLAYILKTFPAFEGTVRKSCTEIATAADISLPKALPRGKQTKRLFEKLLVSDFLSRSSDNDISSVFGYEVTLSSGQILRTFSIDNRPGFIECKTWDGTHRIPTGMVINIQSIKLSSYLQEDIKGIIKSTAKEFIDKHVGNSSYKVTTRNGKIYRASTVDHVPGFLKMQCWDGEHQIPAGEVTHIKSTEVDDIMEIILPVVLFSFVFLFTLMVIFFL